MIVPVSGFGKADPGWESDGIAEALTPALIRWEREIDRGAPRTQGSSFLATLGWYDFILSGFLVGNIGN